MRWQNQRRSKNVENQRGVGGAVNTGIIFMLIRLMFSKFGIGGIAILVVGYVALSQMGIDPLKLLAGNSMSAATEQSAPVTSEYDEMVAAVLGETEDVWTTIFRQAGYNGGSYPQPKLILFTNGVTTACGYAPSAVGPFYCPGDQQVYLDTAFFDELQSKFGVAGDFPPAYVIAHEVGHHVQTVLGISNKVRTAQANASEAESNLLQVRMELQADCFAGLWAHKADDIVLEAGDIEEAMTAAAAIGDDALQRKAGRTTVDTDSFTHGSSAQRQKWFTVGYQTGDVNQCDTFSIQSNRL